eukprot:scaffold79611_cov21-Tisochrysis_lutea.AAC.1
MHWNAAMHFHALGRCRALGNSCTPVRATALEQLHARSKAPRGSIIWAKGPTSDSATLLCIWASLDET